MKRPTKKQVEEVIIKVIGYVGDNNDRRADIAAGYRAGFAAGQRQHEQDEAKRPRTRIKSRRDGRRIRSYRS